VFEGSWLVFTHSKEALADGLWVESGEMPADDFGRAIALDAFGTVVPSDEDTVRT